MAVMKHYDERRLGRKGFIRLMLPHCSSSSKEVRTETQTGKKLGRQEQIIEAMGECWLLACSAYLLIDPRTTRSGMAPITIAWALPHRSLIKKNALQACLQSDLTEAFYQLRFSSFR